MKGNICVNGLDRGKSMKKSVGGKSAMFALPLDSSSRSIISRSKCFNSGKPGHLMRDCRSRKKRNSRQVKWCDLHKNGWMMRRSAKIRWRKTPEITVIITTVTVMTMVRTVVEKWFISPHIHEVVDLSTRQMRLLQLPLGQLYPYTPTSSNLVHLRSNYRGTFSTERNWLYPPRWGYDLF